MFGFSPVRLALHMLCWLTLRILQAFLTCKDSFNSSAFDVWPSGCYLWMFCIWKYVECIHSVRHGIIVPSFFLLSKTLLNVGLFTTWLHLMSEQAGLVSWISSEFHSYISLEVSYIFCKVPTNILLLVDIQNYVRYLYLSVSTMSLW